jgi:hypothetical protein
MKKVSDSTLNKLWRQAVLAYWRYTDPVSHTVDTSGDSLQCHHIIPRRRYVTRWDYRNGLPLTAKSHKWMHEQPLEAAEWISANVPDYEYLVKMGGRLKKEYLLSLGLTDAEFRQQIRDELKRIIEEADYE